MGQQLSMLDRTVVGYTGVDADAVAAAAHTTREAVHESRARLGRRPSDGYPASPHLDRAHQHARRARNLVQLKDDEAAAAWGEATFHVGLAIIDELMRTNRNRSL